MSQNARLIGTSTHRLLRLQALPQSPRGSGCTFGTWACQAGDPSIAVSILIDNSYGVEPGAHDVCMQYDLLYNVSGAVDKEIDAVLEIIVEVCQIELSARIMH